MNLKDPIVVLANGAFPDSAISANILKKAKSIICLDGATNNLIKNGIEPTLIIGDLDSIETKYKIKYQDIIIEKNDKNQNDLRKALNWLEKNNYNSVKILGAAGKREDHFIGNVFGILDTDYSIDIQLITDFGVFQILKKGKHIIPSYIGQAVSFFVSKTPAKASTSLLKYNFIKNTISDSYTYTLNESISNSFRVEILKGKVLLFTEHK
tara:strand:+ start:3372 stop:4001 length:630 start_codon:yes stop_codon:yes gene_type:complete